MRTTVNLNLNISNLITNAALLRNLSDSEMIVILLKKVLADLQQPIRMWRLIEYQKRRPHKDWKPVHVNYNENEYEYFMDLKKISKKSLSLIITQAAEKYLQGINDEKKNYNNLCDVYTVTQEYIYSTRCLKIIWGFPPQLEQHLRYSNKLLNCST